MTAAPEPLTVEDLPAALTVKQAASLWNCSAAAIYDSVQRGDCPVPVLRIGRVIRLPRAAVLEAVGLAQPAEHEHCGRCSAET
jgi:excisionase family DNA binding protein